MKLVKENINFEKPKSIEDFRDNLFGEKLQKITEYVNSVLEDSGEAIDVYDNDGEELDEDELEAYNYMQGMLHVAANIKNILNPVEDS